MRLDCFDPYAEERADVSIRMTLGDQLHDTALSIGERLSRAIASRQKRLQQCLRDLVGEEWPVGGQRGNGLEQVALRIGFQQIAARSGVQDVENQRLVLVPGEDEDLGSWKPPAKMMRSEEHTSEL